MIEMKILQIWRVLHDSWLEFQRLLSCESEFDVPTRTSRFGKLEMPCFGNNS